MSNNNDYSTSNLLDFVLILNYYILIGIDLSQQIELEDADSTQEINFIGRLDGDGGATMYFIIEKKKQNKQLLIFLKTL